MKRTLLATLLALPLTALAADQATAPPAANAPTTEKGLGHDKGKEAFKKADKDNDGTLDREEAKAMPNVSKNFDAIDVNKDGKVSYDEVHNYMHKQKAASQAPAPAK
jgi:EF hand domain-containing protein